MSSQVTIRSFLQAQRSKPAPSAMPKVEAADPHWSFETSDRPKAINAAVWNQIWFPHRDAIFRECARRLRNLAHSPSAVAAELSAECFERDAMCPETTIGQLYVSILAGYGRDEAAAMKRAAATLRKAREVHDVLLGSSTELDRFVSAVIPSGEPESKSLLRSVVAEISQIEMCHREAFLVLPDETEN